MIATLVEGKLDLADCVRATGALMPNGYGRATYDGRQQLAHRVAWQKVNGPIPVNLEVMHRCDIPWCVNVDHLQLGTHAENMADMAAKGRHRPWVELQTNCKRGHLFDDENTRWSERNGMLVRACRTCRRDDARRRYWRN